MIMSRKVSVSKATGIVTLVKGAYLAVEIFAEAKIQSLAP
jgi:hypothetical protein